MIDKSLRIGKKAVLGNVHRAERLLKSLIGVEIKKGASEPPAWQIKKVRFQSIVCRILLVPFGGFLILLMKYWRGYSIENVAQIRLEFKEIWQAREQQREFVPLIICANHLTFIDSALIIWALASNVWYTFNYNAFAWNLPAGDVFKKKLRYHLTLYLTKCIFLDRQGTAAHKNAVLNLCRYLLEKNNVVLIFPEGGRSRSGIFDAERLRFGAGKIIASLDRAQVLCIYLRSDKQNTFSNYPPKNSSFKLKMQLIKPIIEGTTKKQISIAAVKEIGATIKNLENEFFQEINVAKSKIK